MNNPRKDTQSPIQIQQTPYGWTVTFFGPDGHVRHLVNAGSEMQAFRSALNLARLYKQEPKALVITPKGEIEADIQQRLHPGE